MKPFCVHEERICKLNESKNGTPDKYVLDTSALLCYIEEEDGAELVDELLKKGETKQAFLFVPFVSFTEVYYISWQKKGKEVAQARIYLIAQLAIERVESSKQLSLIAGEFKAENKISFADAWVAAVAKEKDAILVHKDPEFEQLKPDIEMLKLPYKEKAKHPAKEEDSE